jgi:S-DNA-T family DNA segregation ATPase FtsK/SpoIIIE
MQNMDEILSSLKIHATCIYSKQYKHFAYFDLVLDPNTSISKLEKKAREISLFLKSHTVPVIRPIPTEGIVRLQVAMKQAEKVDFYKTMANLQPIEGTLPFCLGESEEGNPFWIDMATNPHLLVAGQTGSGKSIFLHTLIANAFCLKNSRKINISLIDPKVVEFQQYKNPIFNSLVSTVISSYSKVIDLLARYEKIMDNRYSVYSKYNIRDVASDPSQFPLDIIIIDEVADLIMQDDKNKTFQKLLTKLAQKGRAAGIFLVAATQRPSRDVLTGLIKASFPARISFAVSSRIDSQVILDKTGAENLLGRGDAIFRSTSIDHMRLQSFYVEPDNILKKLKRQKHFNPKKMLSFTF